MRALPILLAIAAALAAGPAAAVDETLRGEATAVEGDVLMVQGTKVRLAGIDAPDLGQICGTGTGREYDCGDMARRVLAALLAGREIECILSGPPSPDGLRAGTCRAEGKSIAGAMAVRGWAFAAIKLSHRYVPLQAVAQARKAGMWAGRVDAPWNWRTRKLQEAR